MFNNDLVKYYWSTFKFETIISLILLVSFYWFSYNMGCAYQLTNDTIVYGNCKSIDSYEKNKHLYVFELGVGSGHSQGYYLKNYTVQKDDCPICLPCVRITTTTTTLMEVSTSTSTTITSTSTTLKELDDGLSEVDRKRLLNIQSGGLASCAQMGYNRCKADVLDLLKIKPKVNGGVNYGTTGSFSSLGDTKINNSLFCFNRVRGRDYGVNNVSWGFFLNVSGFDLVHTFDNYTLWNKTVVNYTREDSNSKYIYWKEYNISYQFFNESSNYFVYKR